MPAYWTGELEVRATEPNLLATLDSQVAIGVFPNEATARYLVALLGHDAAIELGIDRVEAGTRVAGHATSWTP